MEHVYEVRQFGPYTWGASCITHQRAAVSHSEAKAERALLKKCAEEEARPLTARVVDTRTEATKRRDWYGEEVEEDLGPELE